MVRWNPVRCVRRNYNLSLYWESPYSLFSFLSCFVRINYLELNWIESSRSVFMSSRLFILYHSMLNFTYPLNSIPHCTAPHSPTGPDRFKFILNSARKLLEQEVPGVKRSGNKQNSRTWLWDERGGEGTIAEYRPLYSYDDDDDDDGSRRMSMRADSPHLSSPSLTLQRLESPLLPSNLIDPFTAVDVLIVLTYLHCVVLQLLTAWTECVPRNRLCPARESVISA